jgi:hypothetical protein
MLTIRKRRKTYHVDALMGGTRIRGSLGTRNDDAARRSAHKLETALAEGALSTLWPELEAILPSETYSRFATHSGVKPHQLPAWVKLAESFELYMEQRVKMRKLCQSTVERYQHVLREFGLFLGEQKISLLRDVTMPLVENFKVWRIERIKKRKHSRGATGVVLDAAILHRVFSFAVKRELIVRNPVQLEGRPGENPEGGAEPYTADELSRMRQHAEDDLLAFLLLRWSGLRGLDAVTLRWREVHLDIKEIERVTQKRRKKVILPIHTELQFALEIEQNRQNPNPTVCSSIPPQENR